MNREDMEGSPFDGLPPWHSIGDGRTPLAVRVRGTTLHIQGASHRCTKCFGPGEGATVVDMGGSYPTCPECRSDLRESIQIPLSGWVGLYLFLSRKLTDYSPDDLHRLRSWLDQPTTDGDDP